MLGLLLVGCTLTPAPVLPPPDGRGTCETARDNLEKLGGCDIDLTTFVADCHEREKVEAEVGVRYPVGCLTAGKSCEEEWACR